MTTIFSTKKTLKNRFTKRILGMESLESREMLSVNPLGIDNYYSPDFVQANAAQNFQTEDTPTPTTTIVYTNKGTSLTVGATDVTSASANYTLCYKIGDGTPPIRIKLRAPLIIGFIVLFFFNFLSHFCFFL
jgi:hypothetical protein